MTTWIHSVSYERRDESAMPQSLPYVFGKMGPREWSAHGWRRIAEEEQPPEGYRALTFDILTQANGIDCLVRPIKMEDIASTDAARAAAAAISAAEAETARQNAKSLALKQAENAFLSICEQLTGSKVKLGQPELKAMVEALGTTDPQAALALAVRLLEVNASATREAGLQWWDDCIWHEDIA